jgi:putative membrane protein insertion efficiency factor
MKSYKMLLRLLKKMIVFYGRFISPFFACRCRFVPSCSCYFLEALEIHGYRGIFLGIRRLLRCHPFGGHGLDCVPKLEENNEGKNGKAR